MSDQITKRDLEEILDKKLEEKLVQYQAAILEAVDSKHRIMQSGITEFRAEVRNEISELQKDIRNLTTTLDNFLKRLTDREDEFTILKAEVDQIKAVFKEKFGVEILVQGR